MPCRKATRRQRRRQHGGLGSFRGTVSNNKGRVYHNTDFYGEVPDSRGTDYQWQVINQKLDAHLQQYVDPSNLIQSGFGGNNSDGTVALRKRVDIPPLMFNLDGKNYVLRFERYEDMQNHGAYHANLRNANGRVYHNTNFSGKKGTDYRWQLINKKLEEHLKAHVADSNIVQSGFGGDDGDGTVVVDSRVNIPPMSFSINNKNYVMKFERYEENN